MTELLDIKRYGLDNPEVLEQALGLVPELFAALAISAKLDQSHFPITSDAAIEAALAAAATRKGQFHLPGVTITAGDARNRFPNDFLPVVDRFDLLRKVYMAIVINHEASARAEKNRLQSGAAPLAASHPLPKEVV